MAVDLHEGGDSPVRVTSSTDLDPAAVRAAVEEAGYTHRRPDPAGGPASAAPPAPSHRTAPVTRDTT